MIFFYIREAFKSISRAKLSFIFSLISMSISVLLVTASIVVVQLSEKFQKNIKEEININIFMNDDASSGSIEEIKKNLNQKNYINRLELIDKEKAAEIFVKETGEDFRKLLDYNPLPVSFLVMLKEEYVQKDSIEKIVSELSSIKDVDEVIYEHEYINKFLSLLDNMKKYVFIITGVLLLVSVYIVYSTIKLVTNLKYEELETMKLVGAKLSTIKAPIVLNGILIGFFAGIISLIIFSLFIYYFDNYIGVQKFLSFNNYFYLLVILLTGPLTGLFVSIFSLRKITLKI